MTYEERIAQREMLQRKAIADATACRVPRLPCCV